MNNLSETETQSPTGQGGPSMINGIRIAKACSACSRQKLRCDGSHPCSRCQTMGSAGECVYLPSMRGKIKRKRRVMEDEPDARMQSNSGQGGRSDRGDGRSKSISTGGGGGGGSVDFNKPSLWETSRAGSSSTGYEHRKSHSPITSTTTTTIQLGTTRRDSDQPTLDKLTTTLPLPGDSHNPLAVLVELSEAAATRRGDAASPGMFEGESSQRQREEEEYYAPLERTLKEEAPHIMRFINGHEAKQLFDTFFTHLHPHLPLLDREQSGPSAIARRNNFLFNAICCSAARSYNVVLWARLKDFARSEMERLPREKSIDVVQGHLIYSWWNLIRPTRFEQDMTWLRAGMANRTAIDIALHRVGLLPAARAGLPPSILRAFIRTWLFCFVVDRTLSVQLGKPTDRQWEGEVLKYIEYLRGTTGHQGENVPPSEDDVFTAALAEWALILSHAVDAYRLQAIQSTLPTGGHGPSSGLALAFATQLKEWRENALSSWISLHDPNLHESSPCIGGHFEVYEYYARLVIQSLALQHAQDAAPLTLPSTFLEYRDCAIHLIESIERSRKPSVSIRSLPDFVHTALTYAATSLLRCTQARFANLNPDRQHIFDTARKAADMLAEAAIDSGHIAAIQSALLSKLITARDVDSNKKAVRGTASDMGVPTISPTMPVKMPLGAIDFEGFARALNGDQNMTPWPPILPMNNQTGDNTRWMPDLPTVDNLPGITGNLGNNDSNGFDAGGLASWVSQQDLSVGGTGLGPGLDDFLNMGVGGMDPGFFSDAAWQALFQAGDGNPFSQQ